MLVQRVAPRVVMDVLGHSQISMTMNTYSHVIPELRRSAAAWSTNASQAVIQRRILTRPLAPTQDLTVLRGAGRECGRRVEAGRLRPAPRQPRHPTRWRLARSAGEGHQSPGRAPGRC